MIARIGTLRSYLNLTSDSIETGLRSMIEGMAIKNSFLNYANRKEEIIYSEAFEIGKMVKGLNDF